MEKRYSKYLFLFYILSMIIMSYFYIRYYILFPININNYFKSLISNKILLLEKHRMYLQAFNKNIQNMENNMPNEYVDEFKQNFYYIVDHKSQRIEKLYFKDIRNYYFCFYTKKRYEYYYYDFEEFTKKNKLEKKYLDSDKILSNYFKFNFKNLLGFILLILNIVMIKILKKYLSYRILIYSTVYLLILNSIFILLLLYFNLDQMKYLVTFHKVKFEIEKMSMTEKINYLKQIKYKTKLYNEKTNLELKTILTNSNYEFIYDNNSKLVRINNPDASYYWYNPYKGIRYKSLFYNVNTEEISFETEKKRPNRWPENKYLIQLNENMKLLEYLFISILLEIIIICMFFKRKND